MDVRTRYFPRWDKRREWRISFGTRSQLRDNTGYCDAKMKVVYLDRKAFSSMSVDGKRAFIIHEICHDVGAASHNRRWAIRMERAARVAGQSGEGEVADILRDEIYSYFGNGLSLEYKSSGVLDYLDELLSNNPGLSLDTIRKRVARFFGYRISKIDRDFGRQIKEFVEDPRDE